MIRAARVTWILFLITLSIVLVPSCAKNPRSDDRPRPASGPWPALPPEASVEVEVGDAKSDVSSLRMGFLAEVDVAPDGARLSESGSSVLLTLRNSSSAKASVVLFTSFQRVRFESVAGDLAVQPDGTVAGDVPSMETAVLRVTALGVGEPEEPGEQIEIHSESGGVDRIDAWIVPLLGEWRPAQDDGTELDLGVVAVHAAMLRQGDSAQVLFFSPPREKNRDGSFKKRKWRPERGGGYWWKIWQIDDVEIALWDLATGRVEERPMDRPQNLFCSGHAHLPDGRLLVVGGHVGVFVHNADKLHVFDASRGGHWWSQLGAELSETRWYPTVTTLPDGKMLITSGRGAPLLGSFVDQILGWYDTARLTYEIFDPESEKLVTLSRPEAEKWFVNDEKSATYPTVVALPGGASYPDGVLLAQERNKMWIFGYRSQAARIEALTATPYSMQTLGSRSYPYYGSAALLPFAAEGESRFRMLIVGGQHETNDDHEDYREDQVPTRTAEIFTFDPAKAPEAQDGWKRIGSLTHERLLPSATQLADGTVLVTGGSRKGWANCNSGPVFLSELFDPEATAPGFVQMAPAGRARRYHSTAMLLPDGTLLSTGSTGGYNVDNRCIAPEFVAERFYPPYLWRGVRPVLRSLSPGDIAYGATWSMEVETAQPGGLRVALVRLASVTHGNNMDQRFLWLAERNRTAIEGGLRLTIAAPGDGAVAPPGDYMLFVLDGAGVPSQARFVRLLPGG